MTNTFLVVIESPGHLRVHAEELKAYLSDILPNRKMAVKETQQLIEPPKEGEAIKMADQRWHKNGDHALDECQEIVGAEGPFLSEGKFVRYFRHPEVPGQSICDRCGKTFHEHGWIDDGAGWIGVPSGGITVCPGNWIVWDGFKVRTFNAEGYRAYTFRKSVKANPNPHAPL